MKIRDEIKKQQKEKRMNRNKIIENFFFFLVQIVCSMHLNKFIETSFLLRLTFKTIQYIEFIRNLKEKSYTNYKQFKKVSVPSR